MAGSAGSHGCKEWEETLEKALSFGWTVKTHSNHNIKRATCPAGPGGCTFKVFSTGRGTENVARHTMVSKVLACPHRDVSGELSTATHHLDNADRHLENAAALIRHSDSQARQEQALALLELADEQAHLAADELFASATRDQEEADAFLEQAEVSVDEEPRAEVRGAGQSLSKARRALDGLPTGKTDVSCARERLETLKSRREYLQTCMSSTRG